VPFQRRVSNPPNRNPPNRNPPSPNPPAPQPAAAARADADDAPARTTRSYWRTTRLTMVPAGSVAVGPETWLITASSSIGIVDG